MTSSTARANAAPRVMIATPTRCSVHAGYVTSLLTTDRALRDEGVRYALRLQHNVTMVSVGRSALVAEFLALGAERLVFVDSDMEWDPATFLRLIGHDVDVVAAACPHRRNRTEGVAAELLVDDAGCGLGCAGGLVAVRGVGAAFMCITRQALLRMVDSGLVAKLRSDNDVLAQWLSPVRGAGQHWFDFFPLVPDADGRLASEDFAFCALVRQCGMMVWCDPSLRVRHWGEFPFEAAGPMACLARQAAEALARSAAS